MEIIKKGKLPEDREYHTTCNTCKTEFKFKEKEGNVTHDQRDGSFVSVSCPMCSNTVHVSFNCWEY